jgi:hypothetical protein
MPGYCRQLIWAPQRRFLEEYLSTTCPDCDYVNAGEKAHGRFQVVGQLQFSARRFRVPDVCVVAGPEGSRMYG